MNSKRSEPAEGGTSAHDEVDLGVASVETKGGGVLPQPDSNQPMRQGIGIQQD